MIFESRWLQNAEEELHECMVALQTSEDADTRASMDALRELLIKKLRNHHRNVGTLGCQEASAERKRVCRELGLLREEDQNMVNSLYGLLTAARVVTSLEEDKEDNALFLTQQTPPCVPQTTPA